MVAADGAGSMAKLQKAKRSSGPHHHARHSTSSQPSQPRVKPVRLTPAEIRAQNNGELSRSQSQIVQNSPSGQLSESNVTPPPSPTKEESAYQTQLAKTAAQLQQPPTPPRSPRISHSKTAPTRQHGLPIPQPVVSQYRQSMPIEAYRGIVGTPPSSSSRTSSISGSIKAPMKYRGHEITRTGSLSMFQAPQPDIVMNPLSNFSRPRNKYSPPGSFNRQDGSAESYEAQHKRSDTTDSGVSSLLSRSESPTVRASSPISARTAGSRSSRQFVIVTEDSLPKTNDGKDSIAEPHVDTVPAMKPAESPKRSRDIKKTSSVNLDKAVTSAVEAETKKKRRHTFSWKRMSGMDPKTDMKKDLEVPKEEAAAAEAEKPPSPHGVDEAIAEETVVPVKEDKGKGKEVAHDHGPPVMGVKCCDKCGRIKKLQDGSALVNDGKTREAFVVAGPSAYKLVTTNTDKPGSSLANPAGAANAAQLIMHRQRRPKPEPPAALPNGHVVRDFAATTAPAIATEAALEVIHRKPVGSPEPPVRITRFASLHGISQEKEIVPPMIALNTDINDNQPEDNPQMKATSTPIDEPLPDFVYDPPEDEDHFVEAPTHQKRYSFESQRSVIDVATSEKPIEVQNSAPEVVLKKPREPLDLSKPLFLPEPNLGLHFARSNLTLRGLVLPKGGSTANLLADVMGAPSDSNEVEKGLERSDQMDQMRREHQSRVSEIMAV